MSTNIDRYKSEGRSLNKLDILTESVGRPLALPEQGQYSRKRKQSISPTNKAKIKIQQHDNEQQQIIEQISKLNRIIRFKSQLIKKKYEFGDITPKQKVRDHKPNNSSSKQIYLRYESNYNPKAFQQLVLNIKKEQYTPDFIASCFPQILNNIDVPLSPSKRKFNVQKEIKSRSNEIKQSFLHNYNNPHHKHARSEAHLAPKSIDKDLKGKVELISHWQDLLQSIIVQQNGSNVFLYIMSHTHPLFIGYVSYGLGIDKVDKGEYSINFDRVYIIESFRTPSQQELIINLFKTLINSLSEGQLNKPLKAYWSIKHYLLGKAERWGWKMTAFKRKHYILIFDM